jgi:hypothetical protein
VSGVAWGCMFWLRMEVIIKSFENKENYIEDTIKFTTLFPCRYLIGDTSHIFIRGSMYKTNALLFFYRKFIKNWI